LTRAKAARDSFSRIVANVILFGTIAVLETFENYVCFTAIQSLFDRYADCSRIRMSGLSMANPSPTRDHDPELSQNLRERRPQYRPDLLCRIIEGEAVILNREAGVLYRLNPTASFIWDCCDGSLRVDEIVARLTSAYDVDLITGEKDVSETILKFESLSLLMRK
jgi:coenzyme PQQ synthesis protein D (PqqD)